MSLRTRLILTHTFVILLALALLTASLFFILRDYQRQVQLSRLGDAAVPLAFQARTLFASNVPFRDVLARLQQQAGTTGTVFLVTEKGVVLADTTYGLANRTIKLNPPVRAEVTRGYFWGSLQLKTGRTLLYVAVLAGQVGGQAVYVALANIERPLFEVLDEIGASLCMAGGITLVVSLVVAILLARSIARPLAQLTEATEAIARGKYEHRVQAKGHDEIGRLAASFNAMAERVQRARQMEKDFVANVSHELKTPLTSIQGFAQAILDGTAQDLAEARRAAQTIYDETARMAHLVGDLLTLARLESGQMPMAREPVDLSDLLPRWIERLQPRARALETRLVTAIDAAEYRRLAEASVLGDAARLEQVVTNLVDNALKYNRPGGSVTITAKVEPVESAGRSTLIARRKILPQLTPQWVRIAITDTGEGIPAEDVPRLFERFYRGDKARVSGGTGLGLSIAWEIVTAHGGTITVASEVGRGSTFTIHLPVKDGGANARGSPPLPL